MMTPKKLYLSAGALGCFSIVALVASLVFFLSSTAVDRQGDSTVDSEVPANSGEVRRSGGGILSRLFSSEPEGLYFRVKMWSWGIEQEHLYFSSDGRIYRGIPLGGLEYFDLDQAERKEPDKVGRFEISGDKITFKWGGAKPSEDTETFKRVENGLELDGLFTGEVAKFGGGRKLNGTWSWGAIVGGGSGATASSGRSITLRSDGSFNSSSIGGTSISAGGDGEVEKSEGASSGTYEVEPNTITLTHADGKVTRHTAYPYGERVDEENPERINIDGTLMKYSQ